MHHYPIIDVWIFFKMLFNAVYIGIHKITSYIDLIDSKFNTSFNIFITRTASPMQYQWHLCFFFDFF